jgi:hypothetical protein
MTFSEHNLNGKSGFQEIIAFTGDGFRLYTLDSWKFPSPEKPL